MRLFDILPWWTWLFGTLGLAGVVALAVLAPAAAMVAERTIAGVIGRMLQTRIGVAVIVGAIALFVGHVGGAMHVQEICEGRLESQRLAAETAGEKRDTTITAKTEQKYTPVIGGLDQHASELQLWVANYERTKLSEMAQAPAAPGRCQLGLGALRLREQREAAGAAASRPKRAPHL